MVETIRKKTSKWEPYDVNDHPFANYTEKDLKGLFGLRPGTVPIMTTAD